MVNSFVPRKPYEMLSIGNEYEAKILLPIGEIEFQKLIWYLKLDK